ncbi:MAG: hypothetical protein BMS9Abin25_0440 [Gammaproteobacteria bacterium]|nr:MAG: hypothetical protein BMS9Abin25_0440 [Gammaproteobacteria bacterium]
MSRNTDSTDNPGTTYTNFPVKITGIVFWGLVLLGLVASAVFISFLDKKTIAEYVENDDILKKLREIGVDYAQGFGITCPEIIKEEMSPSDSVAISLTIAESSLAHSCNRLTALSLPSSERK